MTKSQETQLALHEQRINAIEAYHVRIDTKLDQLIEKLDNQFVLQRNYEKDIKQVEARLQEIESSMVTQSDMKQYQKSQLWQKFMSGLGGIGIAALTWLILFELAKVIK